MTTAHTTNTHAILYSFRRCPYAMRARMALWASGQQVELREVILRDKPPAMLAASPKATVPVLQLPDGEILEESLEIMHWALQTADPHAWLQPSHGTVADMLALIRTCDTDFKYHLDRYKYPSRYEGVKAEDSREKAGHFLSSLEENLLHTPYLFGQKPALADYAIMPFIRQFSGVEKDWWLASPWPKVRAWLDRLLRDPLFENIMTKYPQWQEGGPILWFGPNRD